jgi:predicted NBD/HSP70 family sugar kinase
LRDNRKQRFPSRWDYSQMKHVKVSGTANAMLQNKINTSVVFNYLRQCGPSDRAKIARDLRLSAPTVTRAIENLREDGYISEAGIGMTDLGKKARIFKINAERFFVVGIDLAKMRVRTAVCDFGGSIIENREGFRFSAETNVEIALFTEIDNSLERVRSIFEGRQGQLKAIAVGVPAISNPGTGEITGAVFYDNLVGLDIARLLKHRYSVPVFIDNVANLSAISEHAYGAGKRSANLIFVEISRGVGAGMLFDGNIFRGSGGSAGEIGFSVTSPEGLSYTSGNRGYFESKISLDALAESGRIASLESPRSLLATRATGDPNGVSASLVCRCALEGDDVARRIIQDAVERLSVVVVNLVAAISPEVVVFGGDICTLPGVKELFLDPVDKAISRIVPFSHPHITLSSLAENACVVGAATLAIESLLIGRYPYRI